MSDRMAACKKVWNRYGQRAVCPAAAYLCVDSISYLMNLRGGAVFSYSVWTLVLWVFLTVYFWYALQNCRREAHRGEGGPGGNVFRRRHCFAGFFSLLFGVLTVAGYQLQWQGYTDPGFAGKGLLLLRGCWTGLAVFPLVDKVFLGLDGCRRHGAERGPKETRGSFGIFLGSFFGIWLCWIPVWLAYYPVIMSYDFHKQSLEALLGPQYFNDHHPLAHTWLIYLFRRLGETLGSYETGFACFSLFQQLIVALCLGYCCAVIFRLTGKKRAAVVSAFFFGCFPMVSVFVMCTTKDVLFGAFFVLFLLLSLESAALSGQGREGAKPPGAQRILTGLWVLAGVLMILFRNNALYAMVVSGILYMLFSRPRKRLRALLFVLLIAACGKGALAGIKYGFHAHSGSEIEKYSVIYQSMARVGKMQRGNLSEETYEMLDRYVTEECWEDYNPPLADTIKEPVQRKNFNEKKSWDHMGEVFSAWLRIGMQYPNEYIDAFLDLTRGYWFWDDTSHAEMLGVGTKERMGLLYTYNSAAPESLPGMQHISKFPWLEEKMEKLLSGNAYYAYPVVSNLFKPALWCWLLVFTVLYAVYARDRRLLHVTLYPLSYFATMLLGPTAIVRYVFPFILAAPLLVALLAAADRNGTAAKTV